MKSTVITTCDQNPKPVRPIKPSLNNGRDKSTDHKSNKVKRKIAIITSFPLDPQNPKGGVEAVSVNLVSALALYNDFDIHVITTERGRSSITQSEWKRATIHHLPWRASHVLSHILGKDRKTLSRYLRSLKPNLIHAHDFYGMMIRDTVTPRVFTIHGFIHADTLRSKKIGRLIRSKIWQRLELASWARQPNIIAISPYVREKLSGIAKGVIHDIDNPIARECFSLKRNEIPNTIFSAALIGPRKNTLGLLRAFKKLIALGVNAELRLAGSVADENYGQTIRKYIADNNLVGRVILLGKLSIAEIYRELERASIFALVSLEEGAPMGVSEAMAGGAVVVTSNRCGMPYMLRDGESGVLVDPENYAQIAIAFATLLADDKLRNRMARYARQIAMDRFHPQCVAARTRQLYLKLMGAQNAVL